MVSKSANRPGTRRRGAALESAILDAAWAELAEVGYDGVTMEAVAERAGTSKAVLYRRWPSRAPLLLDAYRRQVTPIADAVPDTGSLRGDLLAVLHAVRDHWEVLERAAPGATRGFFHDLDEAVGDPRSLGAPAVERIVKRAQARGEVGRGTVPPRVLALALDLERHDVLATGRPPSDQALAEMVDQIVLPVLHAHR